MSRFQEQLKRQLGFLQRSAASFDQGYTDEAVRLATVMRILMHDTKRQTSLLSHLDAWNINLLSTCPQLGPNTVLFSGMGIHELGPGGGRLRPSLGDDEVWELSAKDWWGQTVFVLPPGMPVTRGNLVLTAANKDGGAHVDAQLTPEYERLARDGALVSYKDEASGAVVPAKEAHLVAIRTMAWELRNSRDLLELGSFGESDS